MPITVPERAPRPTTATFANLIWLSADVLRGPVRPPPLLMERRSSLTFAAVTGQIDVEIAP